MSGKQMEGDNKERRKMAKEARDEGSRPSEVGATLGASKQRTKADADATHQEKLDLKRQGKHDVIRENTPEAKPGSRDADTLDRERHPRL
jgi:D-alanine-D-alanine ligase-like ATP-grasp enzyme